MAGCGFKGPRNNTCCLPPEHVRGGGGELHLRGLEEGLTDHLLAGRQQRARGGRPGGPDAGRAQGEWRGRGAAQEVGGALVSLGSRCHWHYRFKEE